jgi:hypothetical protein
MLQVSPRAGVVVNANILYEYADLTTSPNIIDTFKCCPCLHPFGTTFMGSVDTGAGEQAGPESRSFA